MSKYQPNLEETKVKLSSYNGGDTPAIGICELNLENKNGNHQVTFSVADAE